MSAWIAVEGVEGSGKSTLASVLSDRLGVELAPEFSQAAFGEALRSAVQETPHYISSSAVGQSLVFMGDFIEVVEAYVLPAVHSGQTVVSDRGPLMKYAYQVAVLEGVIGAQTARDTVEAILKLVRHPDLTVYLDCPIDTACARLVVRDGACSPERRRFIERCDVLARQRLPERVEATLTVDATMSVDAIADRVERAARALSAATEI